MTIEEARKIANERFTKLLQPVIDDGEPEPDPEEFNLKVELLKEELLRETGYEVKAFYVNPLGMGLYEVTTVFRTGETRRRAESGLLYS